MAEKDARPPRKGALFGVQRAYVDDLEARLADTETALETAHGENTELTASLESALLALAETTGWSERLPAALQTLAALAAGDLDNEQEQDKDADPGRRLAAAVLALAGEHLLAGVQVSIGEPNGELQRETSVNENGRPVRTAARIGACAVDCTWQPGVDAGSDTTEIVERLATAVVCSLVGVASTRVARDIVTQLGDGKALARHLALRNRQNQPVAIVDVTVSGENRIEFQELFGRMAWDASLADAASALDRLARANGGQAYQTGSQDFRLLVDVDQAEQTSDQAAEALEDYNRLIFRVSIARR
jgi:hypothetical protein